MFFPPHASVGTLISRFIHLNCALSCVTFLFEDTSASCHGRLGSSHSSFFRVHSTVEDGVRKTLTGSPENHGQIAPSPGGSSSRLLTSTDWPNTAPSFNSQHLIMMRFHHENCLRGSPSLEEFEMTCLGQRVVTLGERHTLLVQNIPPCLYKGKIIINCFRRAIGIATEEGRPILIRWGRTTNGHIASCNR